MSQRDLARALRDARPAAPPELRERVRLVAAQATPPRRHVVTWRRALAVAVPVAAAAAAAVVVTWPTHNLPRQRALAPLQVQHGATAAASPPVLGKAAPSHAATDIAPAAVPSNPHRVQRYNATLTLRVKNSAAVSSASKRAVAIAHALGGYELRVNVDAARSSGAADLVLRVPRTHVQEAVRRLTALGTILHENVQVQDLQGGIDTTERKIARLQHRLTLLRAQPQDTKTEQQIASLTAQVERLQRNRAATIRAARFATVDVQLEAPSKPAAVAPQRHHGPLHGIGVAFRWLGIGAVYAAAIGGVVAAVALLVWLAVRTVRRRREDALLSRP
jgi:hypothetical protein